MDKVKCKFVCGAVIDTAYNGVSSREVKFNAVYSQEGENAQFSKATPSGNLSLFIDKETPAYDHFKPGQAYYLTIEEVPTPTV